MSRDPVTITEMTRRLRRRGWSIRHELRSNEPALIVLCAPLGAFVGLVVVAMHKFVVWLSSILHCRRARH